MKKQAAILGIFLTAMFSLHAQTKTLTLSDAVQMGVQNSKQLKLSQYKIDEAVTRFDQAKDRSLPTAKVSAGYSHALMLSNKLSFAGDSGKTTSIKLPFDNPLYQATISVNEPIFAGHQVRYAKMSADLLVKAGKLDAEKDKDEVVYNIINTYINYYKIRQNQDIVVQDMDDIQKKLDEIKKFENEGLATKNDVLRFELQKSNTQLSAIELENSRKIANYNMNILLGLPDSTTIQVEPVTYKLDVNNSFDQYLQQALNDRKEFGSLKYQDELADVNIKKINEEKLPTIGAGFNLYYFNLSKPLIPKSGSYLAPLIVGLNASWDISGFFHNKNKLNEAIVQQREVSAQKELQNDQVKIQVHQSYVQYQQALEQIKVLQDAVDQATENERIMESKFKNNIASTTDRIDAQTLLYQSRINLELAKADATISYYALLKSTGHIQP